MIVTLSDIQQAHERIHTVAIHTPLLPAKFGPANVYFKCENLQRGGAFKIRGAYNNLAQLAPEVRARGVIAYSSGNHAQAVALAAKHFGVPAAIVMLNQSVAEKVARTKEYGAEVIFGGDSSETIKARAEEIAAERDITLIPPFDHPGTIAGQGTIGLEILEDLPEVETLVVPIGGGGLISGIATAVKEIRPSIRVIGVEPEGAPTMCESLKAGKLVTLPETNTIADGLKPARAGDLTFAAVRRYVDETVLVPDSAIMEAVAQLLKQEKLVVEPSGAAGFAAVRSGKVVVSGPTVCVLSGGNITGDLLRSV
ncbi:MAG: threonine ammonia-lyase [Gammaproteobacteria bacterium]